jgi:multidrug efflux system membrane fusion protein
MAQPVSDSKKLAPPRPGVPRADGRPSAAAAPPAPPPAPIQRPILVKKKRSIFGFWSWLILALLAVAALVYYFLPKHGAQPATADAASTDGAKAGGSHHHGGGASDQIRVVVAETTKGDINVYLTGLGAVTPLNTDTIKSRVNGQLMKVLFNEGQTVKEGDLLLQIDSRPYEAQLAQYNAQKEHDQALLENAKIDLQRYQTLWRQDSIPQQTLATQASLVQQDQGTVDSDQALIDATKLNIVYCNITAPINGRIGLRLVDPGNFVQSSDTSGLLVIAQVQPITVLFTIPEDSIQPVVQKLNAGQTLAVDAFNRDMKTQLASGTLLTVDNQIDQSTGTLKLKAIFPNQDNALFPNQFVNARLLVDTKKGIILAPVPAVQHGNNGTFVYVVDTDANTVKMTPVTVGTIDGDNAEIVSGLTEGQTVVTDGVDKLQDGSKVIVQHSASGENKGGATPPPGAENPTAGTGSP